MRDLFEEAIFEQLDEVRKTAGGKGVLLLAEPGLGVCTHSAKYFAQKYSGSATLLAPPVLGYEVKRAWRGRDATVFTPYQVREGLLLDCDVSAEVMFGRLEAFTGKKTLRGLASVLERRMEGSLCEPPFFTTARDNLPLRMMLTTNFGFQMACCRLHGSVDNQPKQA